MNPEQLPNNWLDEEVEAIQRRLGRVKFVDIAEVLQQYLGQTKPLQDSQAKAQE